MRSGFSAADTGDSNTIDTFNGFSANKDEANEEDEKLLLNKVSESGATIVSVLTQILNRLQAEIRMKDNSDFRLLSRLLYQNDSEVIYTIGLITLRSH